MTTIRLPLLDQIQIASPCLARWEDMKGDRVTRHCAQCDLDVHNLSEMTREQAESFLQSKVGDGSVCLRLYRRADGTVLTQDCPVGLAKWRAQARRTAGRIAATLVTLITGGAALSAARGEALTTRLRSAEPFRSVCEWLNPAAPPPTNFIPIGILQGANPLTPALLNRAPVQVPGGVTQ